MAPASERLQLTRDHLTVNPEQENKAKFEIGNHTIDAVRKLRVAVVGAGIAGLLSGALLPAKVPGIELTIFEKNKDVGGVWLENIYPGVRCDVAAHVYQSTFSPNTQWTEEFATGAEIQRYWQNFAKIHDIYHHIQFNAAVQRAEWNSTRRQWTLLIKDVETGQDSQEYFDFILPSHGNFNDWKLPNIPGLRDYEGHLRHTSNWDPTWDPTEKNVAVIGNGASGIQVVPELQKVVKHLDHYARSPTWIAGSLDGRERGVEPKYYTAQQLEDFQDPQKYTAYRKSLEVLYWRRFGIIVKDSVDNQQARKDFTQIMTNRLAGRTDILEAIVPEFAPGCRRLTPGPGYLEALTKENVTFINTPIERFTKSGIQTSDGHHRHVDAIICATGADIDFVPTFPIVSGGTDLSSAWRPGGSIGYPYVYLGIAAPGFPNLLFPHGPNSARPEGSFVHMVENQITYIARLLRKVSTQGIQTVTISEAATDDFIEYCDAFFPNTVWSDNCKSWANGGRPGVHNHGWFPASAAAANLIQRNPRWEDWEYELLATNKSGNRFAYFGNGRTTTETDPVWDPTPYLKTPDKVDLRDWHESWWDL